MIKTKFTEILGVQHPIQCGTMMHISDAEFVGACANAGIFACLASAMFPDEQSLVDEIKKTRDITDKPFGVNVALFPGYDPRTIPVTLDILGKENVAVIETAGRSPEPYLEKIRQTGAVHIHKCARLRDALKADRLGVNMVTVVGAECGGHPGMDDVSTLVLVSEAAERVSIPLIAGGGFCDGKGLMAALALGAVGVVMGSRFLNTDECKIHDSIKRLLENAAMTDTMVIQRSIQSPVRVLQNDWARKIQEMEEKGASLEDLMPFLSGQLSGKAWFDGSSDAVFPCGQVVGRTRDTLPIQKLVDRIMRQAEETAIRIRNYFE